MKKVIFLITLIVLVFPVFVQGQENSDSLMKVDYKSLISKSDLSYDFPTTRSEEGMPVGNGRMGSLVWTTPSALHFQINRIDVFSVGNNTNSFPLAHTTYSNGCGYLDINVSDFGNEAFTGKAFNQHLSVYDGVSTVSGNSITARTLALHDSDVIVTEITDKHTSPSAIEVDLRMLRYVMSYPGNGIRGIDLMNQREVYVQTGKHSAMSRLEIRNGRIILVQEFKEGDFYCASAVAVGIAGRKSKASYFNESTVRLSAEPGEGTFTILTSSSSSSDPDEDVADLAIKKLDAVQSKSFDEFLSDNREWWSNYWSKAFIHLTSPDGIANEVQKNYTYLLYIMASCSRGEYMPRFSGMLWNTSGDMCMWGSQYWWHNQGTYYNGLTPANRPEIMNPVFSTYTKHFESYSRAAQQQWDSKGVWIPETSWFNGLEDLPDNVAKEMRDLYLVRKPWEERSKEFQDYARYKNSLNSRWNWLFMVKTKGGPVARNEYTRFEPQMPFAYVTHIMSSTAKVAYLYWLNYAYYLDKEWLKTDGYPMIKGAAEFYRNFPNLYKGDDGKYHIKYVNNWESRNAWGTEDTPEELSAMVAMFPIAIRASEILGVDKNLRNQWQEILDNLTPIPDSSTPAEYYDICTIGSEDKELFNRIRDAYLESNPNPERTRLGKLGRGAVAASNLGLGERLKVLIPNQMGINREEQDARRPTFRNRLALGEGPGAIECERLGLASQALCTALLQSVPPSPGKEPVNYIFPAWPKEWDAQFTLAARNAFLISASMEEGQVEFVEIQSKKGGQCLVKNPWGESELTIYRNSKKTGTVSGELLTLNSKIGDTIVLVPRGKKLVTKEIF